MKAAVKLFILSAVLIFSTFNQIKAQTDNNLQADRDSVIAAAREIIGQLKFCALVTQDSSGVANVRTMNPFPPENDMTVWMATLSTSRKANDVRRNPKVTLYYANHADMKGYVTISGHAELINDPAEIQKRKREYWTQAFPDWSKLMLVKIIPERLEVVNYHKKMYGNTINWLAPNIYFNKK